MKKYEKRKVEYWEDVLKEYKCDLCKQEMEDKGKQEIKVKKKQYGMVTVEGNLKNMMFVMIVGRIL